MDQDEKELGFMILEALALLLSHNQKNASKRLAFVNMNFFCFSLFLASRNLSRIWRCKTCS